MSKTMKTKPKPNWADTHVGRQINKARKEKKWSQAKLGKSIKKDDQDEITFQQIQKYENGKNRPSAGTLYFIALVLEKPIDWFYPEEVQSHGMQKMQAEIDYLEAVLNTFRFIVHELDKEDDTK